MFGVCFKLRGMSSFRISLSRRAALALPLLAAAPRLIGPAAAQETYPTKTVRIIVPFAPGGSGDITARLIGKYIEDKTGQPFVVDNKAGANGIVGVLAVKSSPADGYTLMLATTSTNAANIHMYKDPGYDPEKDFSVVGVIGLSGAFLVVPADSPYKTLADLIAYAKANPGKLNFGYFNASSQVPAEVLGKQAGGTRLLQFQVFADGDVFHLRRDDAGAGVLELGDDLAGLGAEDAALASVEEADRVAATFGLGLGAVGFGEVAVVNRFDLAASDFLYIATFANPRVANGSEAFGGVGMEGRVAPFAGGVVDADEFVGDLSAVWKLRRRECDLAHRHANVGTAAGDVNAAGGGENCMS